MASPSELLRVSHEAADAIIAALAQHDGRSQTGARAGQYSFDVAADEAAAEVLTAAGLAVFSEESGASGNGDLLAVVDPVDGSTNYSRGIPFSAVSIAVLDDRGPLTGLVVDLSRGTRYAAVRGAGATVDGEPLRRVARSERVVAIAGVPERPGPFAQHRAFGACALECCLVATGALDGYVQVGEGRVHPWDYLAGLLVVAEVGGTAVELDGLALDVADATPRRLVVGGDPAICADLVAWLGEG